MLKPFRGPLNAQQLSIRLLVRATRPRPTNDVRETLRKAVSRCAARDLAETAKHLGIAPLIDSHLERDAALAGSELSSKLKPARMTADASSVILGDVYGRIVEAFAEERVPVAPEGNGLRPPTLPSAPCPYDV
jgi:hypothetical protein